MAEVYSLGQMADATMATITTTESRVSEFSYGRMVAGTREAGSMASSMASDCTILPRATRRRANGAKAKD